MALDKIKTSLHGRMLGIDFFNNLLSNLKDGSQMNRRAFKTITSAQVLALNATPITLVPAAPAGFAHIVKRVLVSKPAGTAYDGIAAGEDLVVKYTNGSGAQASGVIETTGFLDQATAQTRVVGFPGSTGSTAGDVAPVAAAALVMHLLVGEIATGTSDLNVVVEFDTIKVAPTE